jgi:hypothetical protein
MTEIVSTVPVTRMTDVMSTVTAMRRRGRADQFH